MTISRVGEMFGPYELRSQIGIGGMGEVYQAYDTVKDRTVAVKLLRPEFAADHDYQERFRRESRMAARLHEPHVIPVHDFGEINGVLYIDMRFVEGVDLRTVLTDGGPMSPARATSIIGQVAAALDAAHASGLTHRDVKPENVLVTGTDFCYLVDFGIARAGGDSGLTSAGSAIGSCAYMAPERFTGGHVGPAADVYSLACMLYQTLTGQPPFPTGDLTRLMSAHIMAPPPRPSALVRGLNPAFDGLIAWGMAKEPAARCPTAGEFARVASAAAVDQLPTPSFATPDTAPTQLARTGPGLPRRAENPAAGNVKPSDRSGSRRGMIIAAVILLLALVGAGALATWLVLGNTDGSASSTLTPITTLTRPAVTVPSTARVATTTTPPTTTPPTTTQVSLPGTDGLGFVAYPDARCNAGDSPAALGLTAKSALVVCRYAPNGFYYRGVRLSDGASIQLNDATPSSAGFDVVNPADGTRYQIRPNVLTIISPAGDIDTEQMTEYAS